MTRPRLALAAAFLCLVAGSGYVSVAFAATLPVTTAKITTSSIAATVPPSTCTPPPIADAALDRASQGSNYGNLGFLAVRAQNGNNERRSLVRFDIASCNIPSTAMLLSATLKTTVVSAASSSRTYEVHRVTEPWAETSVTYSSQPTFEGGATASIATGTAPASLSWSVLSDVTAFVGGAQANHGWLMKDATERANPAVETTFGSRENPTAENHPSLVIGYYE